MRTFTGLLLAVLLVVLGVGAVGGASIAVWPPARDQLEQARWWWTDESAPVVEIEAPAGVVSGTVRLPVQVRDRRPAALVSVTLDDRPWPLGDEVVIDTTELPDGPHRLVVTAEDRSRRRNRGSASLTFVADNTPPAVQARAVPETVPQGRTAYLEVVSDGQRGQLAVTIGDRPAELYHDTDRSWLVWGVAPAAEPGPRPVLVRAADEAGNVATATLTITVAPFEFPIERINAPDEVATTLTDEVIGQEGSAFETLTSQFRPEKLWAGPFSAPVRAPVSSLFGTRRAYNVAAPGVHHGGTDYAAPLGTPILSDAAGIVALAEFQRVRGNLVVVDHGLGVYSAYFHLNAIEVRPGQRVARGDRIGTVGTTGLSTGPHLHWELRIRGVPVDPLEWTERSVPPPPEG